MKNVLSAKASASFTIEALIVLPLTMLIMAGLVSLAFYLHDAVTIRAACNAQAIRNAELVKEKMNDAAVIESGRPYLVAADDNAIELSVEESKLTASYKGNWGTEVKFHFLDPKSFDQEAEMNSIDARKELLLIKAVADGVEVVKQ